MTQRLSPDDWLNAGLRALATGGPGAVRADRLAKGLKVSRGSFYWHFTSLGDYEARLAAHWRDVTTEGVIERLARIDAPVDRLRALFSTAFDADPGLERSMRAWAAADARVAEVVTGVDRQRLAYLADLLAQAGVARGEAPARAQLIYLANLGRVAAGADGYDLVTIETLMALALTGDDRNAP